MPQVSTSKPTLLFIRHGETPADNPERIDGWMPWGLSPKGFEQALLAAERLKPLKPPVVFASDLLMTKQTAEVIGRVLDARVLLDRGWRSWNTGILSNQLATVAQPFIEFFVKHKDCPIPGGESFAQLLDRATAAIGRAADAAYRLNKTLVVVTSRSVLAAVPTALRGDQGEGAYAELHEIPGGSIMQAAWDGTQWRIDLLK